ncbi:MAG: hypothetical protein H7177_02515 [Rhizobacter sp.]|nr:hypothetical protein [Bacteriovorax sp.]
MKKDLKSAFKIFLLLIGMLLIYKFFNYWVYPIYVKFPFSEAWFVSSPGDGIDLVVTPQDSVEIGKTILSKKKLFIVKGYSVDKYTNHFNSNIFSSRQFSFNGQECSEGFACEEVPIGSKFILRKLFHLKHLGSGGFFNSDYDIYVVTDSNEKEIELHTYMLDYFN